MISKYLFALSLLFVAVTCAHAATYVQPLNCQATSIVLNSPSTSATVECPNVPPPPPPVCTAPYAVPNAAGGHFTRWTSTPTVNFFGLGMHQVDTTKLDSIFGQMPSVTTWPGNSGITAVLPLPINQYLSAVFTVPSGYMANAPSNRYGQYRVNASSFSGAGISGTISTCPGDFSNPASPGSTVVFGCWTNKVRADSSLLFWTSPKGTSQMCALKDGVTYYFNFINADISNILPNAGGSATSTKQGFTNCTTSCNDPIANGIYN